jgi:hypothetical protein
MIHQDKNSGLFMKEKRGFARKLQSRKAQITVFMIVGIILLFSSALIFYIRNQVMMAGIEEAFRPVVEEVPLEAQPIKIFVEDCVAKTAKQAIKQLALHGGYIEPMDAEMSGKAMIFGIEPTESDGIVFFPGGNLTVPYWWYHLTSNDCVSDCKMGTNRPDLYKTAGENSIEMQIDKFINLNLGTCLADFQSFKDQGFTFEVLGSLESDAKITDKEVILLLKYPIRVGRAGRTTDIEQYYTSLDVRMKPIYDLASEVINQAKSNQVFETHTMNLITMYAWPSSPDKIPPISDTRFDPGDYMFWTRIGTQKKLETYVLPGGVGQVQVDKTNNFVRNIWFSKDDSDKYVEDPFKTALTDKMIIQPNLSINFSHLNVKFAYLDWWPIYLALNRNQEVVGPSRLSGAKILSILGINMYRVWYSISYPVLVTIEDPSAFRGEGLSFNYAIEVNIRENAPLNESYSRLSVGNIPRATQVCYPELRNGGPYRIATVDAVTGEPITDARVEFIAAGQTCFIGITKKYYGNDSFIFDKFPVGLGYLKVMKKGYLVYQKPFASTLNRTKEFTVELFPTKKINATIFVKGLNFDQGIYVLPAAAPSSPVSPKEQAIIMLKRTTNDSVGAFDAFVMISGVNTTEIELLPGDYEVTGFLLKEDKNNPMRIPAEDIKVEVPFMKDQNIHFDEMTFEAYPDGGIIFNQENGYLNIPVDQLYDSKKVIFYVLRFPPPITHTESMKNAPGLEQLGRVKEFSTIYRSELLPQWVIT